MKQVMVLLGMMTILLSACGASTGEGIEIHTPWTRPTVQGDNEAIYFELHNYSSDTDVMTGASSDLADVIEIHETKMEGDIMQMNMIPSLPVEAFADLSFAPGKLHVMLVNIKREVKVGDQVTVVLHFKNHEDITIKVPVRDTAPEDH